MIIESGVPCAQHKEHCTCVGGMVRVVKQRVTSERVGAGGSAVGINVYIPIGCPV